MCSTVFKNKNNSEMAQMILQYNRSDKGVLRTENLFQGIRDNEKRFRAFMSACSQVIYRMSPNWDEMYYLQGRDFIPDTDDPNSSWLDKYIHPDDQPQVLPVINEAIQTKSVFELEHRALQADGSWSWTLSRAVPLLDEDGEITEWIGTASDITARKQAEEALQKSEVQLEADLKAAKLLQNISTQMLCEDDIQALYDKIVDTAMQIMRSDFGSLQVMRRERGESGALKLMVHKGFTQLAAEFWDWVDYGDITTCSVAMNNRSSIIVPDIEKWDIAQGAENLAVYRKSGIRACQSTPLVSRNGELLGMFSTYWRQPYTPTEREIDLISILARQAAGLIERKIMEEQQHDSKMRALALVSELEKADKNKNEFISVLSHELRNPLAAISTGVQILDVTQDVNKTEKAKEIIKRQTNQLCKLVDDLLELTRITQNKIKLKKEYIDLNEIAKGAAEDMKPEFEKKGINLDLKIQAQPISLNADPVRVAQMIGNILRNALKFTQTDGVVRLTLKQENNDAVIIIEDNGAGISAEILPNLFTPFTQAENTLDRSAGGLGLGLSIVKGIVDLHQGNVSAYSEGMGKGASFTIRLPIFIDLSQKYQK